MMMPMMKRRKLKLFLESPLLFLTLMGKLTEWKTSGLLQV